MVVSTDWELTASFIAGIAMAAVSVFLVVWWRRGRAARSGRRGERMVGKELARLSRRDFIVLNDLLLPSAGGRTSQIDHVVVSTKGIFVIETKNHAGRIVGGEHSQYWQQHLSERSVSFYNPLLQNKSHLRALRRLLPKVDKSLFVSVTVFAAAWRLDIKADDIVVERSLLPDRHIRRTLVPEERKPRRWWRPGKEVRLDAHCIVTRLDGLNKELKRRPRLIDRDSLQPVADAILAVNISGSAPRRQHTRYAKDTSRSISGEISRGICPRCGAPLTIRIGDSGEFAGCSRYPECRFSCSIDRLHSSNPKQ